jgi:dTMP kinase
MQTNNYPGKFIVFEGLDGSGQTTQVSRLGYFLSSEGISVVSTKEPTMDSEAGRRIREILDEKEKIEPLELQKLFVQDRREHLDNLIIPALKEGKWVISDRYFFSTFAFGSSDSLGLEQLIEMNNEFLLPDLTILLKVSTEVCVQRIEKRGEGIKLFEKKEKLTKVWETYKILPERFPNMHVIDGEKSIEEIHNQIKNIIKEKLN